MSTLYYQGESKFFVAVDCILIGFDNRELHVLLYKRSFEPLKGSWSLMGGFVREGESVSQAANRVLTDCSGVDNLFMEQVGVYGEITRDLGDRVISAAYYALVNMASIDVDTLKAHDAVWVKITELPELIFDHKQMIEDSIAILQRKAATHQLDLIFFPRSSLYHNCKHCMKPFIRHPWTSEISARKLILWIYWKNWKKRIKAHLREVLSIILSIRKSMMICSIKVFVFLCN